MTEQSESDEQGGNQSPSQQMKSPVDETVSETIRLQGVGALNAAMHGVTAFLLKNEPTS